MNGLHKPREGDLYKIISERGKVFVLKYGFYSDSEREFGEPIPILPDFVNSPMFTDDGYLFVTSIQDVCEYYSPKNGSGDGWCADCINYMSEGDEIGICQSEKNKKI